jgi:pimeloyl-ACP methyl ester carboxylesterase
MKRVVTLSTGIEIALDDVGTGPAVVMIHGWPEMKYSWRHQLPALAEAGYRALAFDCRGYGGSSKPDDVAAYGLRDVVGDLMELLDVEGLDDPVLVGHDWGSIVMWTAAVLHPDRFRALVSLNVPYRGWCVGFPRTDYIREHLADRFGYVLYFQEEGPAEARFAADPDKFLGGVYSSIAKDPGFLAPGDFAVYRNAFVAGGISGPLNYYRNIDTNHDALAEFENAPIDLPTLVLAADSDPVLPPALIDGMERWVSNLSVIAVSDCGHWTQQEQPKQVGVALVEFLGGLRR